MRSTPTNIVDKIDEYVSSEPDPGFARRARLILKHLEIRGKETVVEVGCGRGYYLLAVATLYPTVKMIGLDVNEAYIERARQTVAGLPVKVVKGDGRTLPFKDTSIDRIICTEVLEHIDADREALKELYRVLKPGGIALFTVPHNNYPFFWDPLNWMLEHLFHTHIPHHIWWLAGIWADHVRLYSVKELREKVQTASFKIDHEWYITKYCLPFAHFLLYGIGKNIVERGMAPSFNRFSAGNKKQGLLLGFVLGIFQFFDRKNDTLSLSEHDPFLNIVMKVHRP